MSSYEHIDDLRGMWQQLGQNNSTPSGASDARRVLEYVRRSERRSVVSSLVRRHIMLAVLGIVVLPADMAVIYMQFDAPFYVALLLSVFGLFAGVCALWVAWQVHSFDYGGQSMRDAWHKANVLYNRRNKLRNISLCIGIPLAILLIVSMGNAMGRPALVGGIVGGIIGGAIGLYINWRTQRQLRQIRDSFDESFADIC